MKENFNSAILIIILTLQLCCNAFIFYMLYLNHRMNREALIDREMIVNYNYPPESIINKK